MRTPIVIGNWKMNLDHHEAADWMRAYAGMKADALDVDTGVLPSFTSLPTTVDIIHRLGLHVGVGAQTMGEPQSGAFTGDVSAGMLHALACDYVLLGHSEQRRNHPEDDDRIAVKTRIALDNGLAPIICIGETKLGREHGIGIDYALNQLAEAVGLLSCADMRTCIIAYEPVWSIGTGRTPTMPVIESALADIRDFLNATFGADAANGTRILYGGSVNADNAGDIIRLHDVDGFLVGGASLEAGSFAAIVSAVDANNADRLHRPCGGVGAVEPEPMDDSGLDSHDADAAETLAEAHDDTYAWRAQLALAAYRTVGFQWLERNADNALKQAACGDDADNAGIGVDNPDMLRDAIWSNRRDIITRTMRLIERGRLRGVSSVNEWLIMQDDSLTHDERCERLTQARAQAAANIAYADMQIAGIGRNAFREVFIAGYLTADADTRNRHWRRRGIDRKIMKP